MARVKLTKKMAPFAVLGGAVLIAILLFLSRSTPEQRPPPPNRPLVRATQVEVKPYRFVVRTQGTVVPRTQSDLVSQVAGEVQWVSPALASGGFFSKGEPLVRVERVDYEAELESARAAVARTESEYSRARKERDRQRRLADRSVASQSRIDDAENGFRVADAALREARARRGRAERDLDRTEIRAPYDGRVRSENVDVGQFVTRGAQIARIYAVDYAEVRLPLPDRELRYLDLSLAYRRSAEFEAPVEPAALAVDPDEAADAPSADVDQIAPAPPPAQMPSGPEVILRAEFAGAEHEWRGQVVRTEGELDAKSRMLGVVARVDDPYAQDESGRPPLAVGLFVEADILGREIDRAVLLPRTALRDGGRVLVIDAEDQLRFRDVELLRAEREQIVIGAGLEAGERVCVSPLLAAVEGMAVRVAGDPPAEAAALPAASEEAS